MFGAIIQPERVPRAIREASEDDARSGPVDEEEAERRAVQRRAFANNIVVQVSRLTYDSGEVDIARRAIFCCRRGSKEGRTSRASRCNHICNHLPNMAGAARARAVPPEHRAVERGAYRFRRRD
jgi:hypothetical protein